MHQLQWSRILFICLLVLLHMTHGLTQTMFLFLMFSEVSMIFQQPDQDIKAFRGNIGSHIAIGEIYLLMSMRWNDFHTNCPMLCPFNYFSIWALVEEILEIRFTKECTENFSVSRSYMFLLNQTPVTLLIYSSLGNLGSVARRCFFL